MTMDSDRDIEAGLPRTQSPTYQVPDWEGTVRPPTIKNSVISKVADRTKSLKPSFILPSLQRHPLATTVGSRSSTGSSLGGDEHKEKGDKAFEAGLGGSGLARHDTSFYVGTTSKATAAGALAGIKATLSRGIDKVVPRNRTYFGRPRKFFLLAIVLPLAILFLLILPLALGLGLSKGRKEALPLPSNKDVFAGDLTFYSPGLGACGWTSADSEDVAAVSRLLWDEVQVGSNPNTNPLCGKMIRVQREFDGNLRSVDVKVVDRCVGCEANDLDLTISVFTQLAREERGRVVGHWAWLNTDNE